MHLLKVDFLKKKKHPTARLKSRNQKAEADHAGATQTCGWDLWKSSSSKFPTPRYNENFTFFSANFTAEIQSGFHQLSLEEEEEGVGGVGDKTVYLLESYHFKGGRE